MTADCIDRRWWQQKAVEEDSRDRRCTKAAVVEGKMAVEEDRRRWRWQKEGICVGRWLWQMKATEAGRKIEGGGNGGGNKKRQRKKATE